MLKRLIRTVSFHPSLMFALLLFGPLDDCNLKSML